jgi:hypothetical protein
MFASCLPTLLLWRWRQNIGLESRWTPRSHHATPPPFPVVRIWSLTTLRSVFVILPVRMRETRNSLCIASSALDYRNSGAETRHLQRECPLFCVALIVAVVAIVSLVTVSLLKAPNRYGLKYYHSSGPSLIAICRHRTFVILSLGCLQLY